MTYFGVFCYLNSSWIRKSITLIFMSSWRNKYKLLYQNSVNITDVFVRFRPPCWCPYRWAPAWRLHTNLYKLGKTSRIRDILLARILAFISQIPDFIYLTVLILILIYFEWQDTENQKYNQKYSPYIICIFSLH